MAFDFPNSPTIGQQFQAGTVTWEWDGTAWNIVPLITPPIADDDPPANPYNGQLWWNANNGNLYVWYDDGNSAAWVQTAGNTGQAKTAETRNRLVNGSLQISQENGDVAGTTSGYCPADMWYGYHAGLTGFATARQSSGMLPSGSRYQISITATSKPSLAAGDYLFFRHQIEGFEVADFRWGLADAKQAVLRFAVYAPLAGTYCVSIRNGTTSDRTFLAEYTIAANEVGKWVTKTIVVPGDTTGTWNVVNAAGISVSLVAACGTTNHGVVGWQDGNKVATPNQVNATGLSCYFGEIGFYRDPDKTGVAPPFEMPNIGDELEKCRRYWESAGGLAIYAFPRFNSDGYRLLWIPYQTAKRIIPTTTAQGRLNAGALSGLGIDNGTIGGLNISHPVVTPASDYVTIASWIANARM